MQKILEVKFDNPEWVIRHQDNDYFTFEGGNVLEAVLRKTGRGGVFQVSSPLHNDALQSVRYTGVPTLILTYRDGKLVVETPQSSLKNGALDPKYQPFLRKFVANLQEILENRSGMMELPYNTKAIDTATGKQLPEDIAKIIGMSIPPAKVSNPLKKLAKGGRLRKTHRKNNKKRRTLKKKQ